MKPLPPSLQVLATVKQQIEHLAASRADFTEMITAAQHWLLARETTYIAAGNVVIEKSVNNGK